MSPAVAGALRVVGHGQDDPVARQVGQVLLEFAVLDVQVDREAAVLDELVRAAQVQHQQLVGLGEQCIDLGSLQALGLVLPVGGRHRGSGRSLGMSQGAGAEQGDQRKGAKRLHGQVK